MLGHYLRILSHFQFNLPPSDISGPTPNHQVHNTTTSGLSPRTHHSPIQTPIKPSKHHHSTSIFPPQGSLDGHDAVIKQTPSPAATTSTPSLMKRARYEDQSQNTNQNQNQDTQVYVSHVISDNRAGTTVSLQKEREENGDGEVIVGGNSASGNASGSGSVLKPRTSKKNQACTECQSRKIRCDLSQGGSSCSRCSKKGLKCAVNKTLQSILADEAAWKTGMEQTTQTLQMTSSQLQAALVKVLEVLKLPDLSTFVVAEKSPPQDLTPRTMAMARESSNEPDGPPEDDGTLVAAPMGTLYEVTKLRHLRGNPRAQPGVNANLENDFISKGIISETEAQELFESFNKSLNHYLWGGIALVHSNLTSVRRSSSLLLAAILTVTALHIPGKTKTFDICYSEFLSLVSSAMLDFYHTLDGVRGLCIGAFWLSDLSWKLSGHAVRIATELNLHQSYARAIKGAPEHIEGARLWYFLYVCDHHFSISYGRPPLIHEDRAIAGHEKFLQLPGIVEADFRLHSNVSIFIILTKMYNTFGPNIEQMLDEDELNLLQQFNVDLDSWRLRWESQLAPNPYVSTYPAKGIILHYNFGRLQLNSLSLRGFQELTAQELSPARRECANLAISCAIAILQQVVSQPDIQNGLVGVPLYLHTMITYAAAFLLKVDQKWKTLRLGTDTLLIRDLVEQVIELLANVKACERHLAYHIADGLGKMLKRTSQEQAVGDDINVIDKNTSESMLPVYGMNDYAFSLSGELMDMFDERYFPLGSFGITSNNGVGQY